MISALTYIPFVAPVLMGLCGLVIYFITDRLARSADPHRPAREARHVPGPSVSGP